MNEIVPNGFGDFYRALWTRDPFPWQELVAERVASGKRWPRGIALPTGSGKTSCLEIAVFSLACQATLPATERTAPRRIFFVIDRRIVVDEAYEHAKRLANRLDSADDGPLARVAENLRELSQSSAPLTVHRMRGGTLRDITWTRNPAQPAIILSTVDQVGSRMLFRGYGVSPRMSPVHASLTVNDSLILLDEAHCARPFASTAAAIERYRTSGETPILLPFQTVVLSATLPPEIGSDVQRLRAEDRRHKVLGPRLRASKQARLVVANGARGDRVLEKFAEELAHEAQLMLGRGRKTVAVMVNRVHTARLVRDCLRGRFDFDVLLMTGRMRPLDRDALISEWKSRIEPMESGESPLRPTVLVSTQCLEVGANLSFEGLVTECASLDALRQRFGRLNRFAERLQSESCEAVVMVQPSQTKESDDDPVYGASLAETWRWLESIAENRMVNFGIDAMATSVETVGADALSAMLAPSPEAPAILPAHLDFWVQTSPRPAPDPDPAVFLHGIERGSPDVQVCWRADLPPENPEKWPDIVAALPPTPGETVQVPLWVARGWIAGNESAGEQLSDVENTSPPEPPRQRTVAHALRWRGGNDSRVVSYAGEIRPGDTLVVPAPGSAEMSLLDIEKRWGALGHFHEGAAGRPRMDLAELSFLEARDLPALRITKEVVVLWGGAAASSRVSHFFSVCEDLSDAQREDLKEILQVVCMELQEERIAAVLGALLRTWSTISVHCHPAGGVVLKGRQRITAESLPPAEDVPSDEEELDTSCSSRYVPLRLHLRDVETRSMSLAKSCGLSAELAEVIALAGRFHDVGKADMRFQLMLHRGDEWSAAMAGDLWAKSPDVPLFGQAARRIQRDVGLPEGFRHELVSVRMAETSTHVAQHSNESNDLMLHLIASHHGYCRPFAPVVLDRDPVGVAFNLNGVKFCTSSATGLELIDSGVADRFWRLVRRYGWWGLAFLEAIMRLADHLESERREREAVVSNQFMDTQKESVVS